MLASGGMPSSHTATVTALAIAIGLQEGSGAPTFAIALVLACVVCIVSWVSSIFRVEMLDYVFILKKINFFLFLHFHVLFSQMISSCRKSLLFPPSIIRLLAQSFVICGALVILLTSMLIR